MTLRRWYRRSSMVCGLVLLGEDGGSSRNWQSNSGRGEKGSLPYGSAPEAAINDCRLISLEDGSRRGGGILGRSVGLLIVVVNAWAVQVLAS